jgi:polyketide cyclase/dehydrase/lipid transport protein
MRRIVLVMGGAALLAAVVAGIRRARSREAAPAIPLMVSESVSIERPQQEVFDYVSDPNNLPEWSEIIREVRKETDGPPEEGERYTASVGFLGRSFEQSFAVAAHEPPRRHSERSEGPRSRRSTPTPSRRSLEEGRGCRWPGRYSRAASSRWRDRCLRGKLSAKQERNWRSSQGCIGGARLDTRKAAGSEQVRALRNSAAFFLPLCTQVSRRKRISRKSISRILHSPASIGAVHRLSRTCKV